MGTNKLTHAYKDSNTYGTYMYIYMHVYVNIHTWSRVGWSSTHKASPTQIHTRAKENTQKDSLLHTHMDQDGTYIAEFLTRTQLPYVRSHLLDGMYAWYVKASVARVAIHEACGSSAQCKRR